jgi:hypothetical protein
MVIGQWFTAKSFILLLTTSLSHLRNQKVYQELHSITNNQPFTSKEPEGTVFSFTQTLTLMSLLCHEISTLCRVSKNIYLYD